MLIDNPMALVAACTIGAAAVNLTMLKLSPAIEDRLRHSVSGTGPVIASLVALIGTNDSVVAYGTDLLALGASLVGGMAAAIGTTKFVRPQRALPKA